MVWGVTARVCRHWNLEKLQHFFSQNFEAKKGLKSAKVGNLLASVATRKEN
jgi:hypothetical protein